MTDMTVGSPHSHLWRCALPLLLGNWLPKDKMAALFVTGRVRRKWLLWAVST